MTYVACEAAANWYSLISTSMYNTYATVKLDWRKSAKGGGGGTPRKYKVHA